MRFGIFSVVDHYSTEVERSQEQFLNELCEQGELADKLGFHSFWIAEHHFHEYGLVPRPAILLSAIAARTQRIRLGTAVAVLPFDCPMRAAEDFAMLDLLSGGRLDLGVGSGYLQHEFAGFQLDLAERRERFDEALAIIRKAWKGDTFSFKGRFNNIENTALNISPKQKPEPPIHIAVLRNEVAPFVGKQKTGMMLIPYATTDSLSQLSDTCQAYNTAFNSNESAHEQQRLQNTRQISFGLHTFCSDNTTEARTFARPFMERYVRTRLYAKQRSFEELIEKELLAVGDPQEIIRIAKLYEACGLTDFLMIMNFGALPHTSVMRSMELVAKHVMHAFQERTCDTAK